MKMTLNCSDSKCEGLAEIKLNGEEKDISIKKKCSIKMKEHTYNYKRFFVEKIRQFDIVHEEFTFHQIQKIIFRELFVHCFELKVPQAIELFKKKFQLTPVLTIKEIEEIKKNFLSEILDDEQNKENSKEETNLNKNDSLISKKKIITRSRKFWKAFEDLL